MERSLPDEHLSATKATDKTPVSTDSESVNKTRSKRDFEHVSESWEYHVVTEGVHYPNKKHRN